MAHPICFTESSAPGHSGRAFDEITSVWSGESCSSLLWALVFSPEPPYSYTSFGAYIFALTVAPTEPTESLLARPVMRGDAAGSRNSWRSRRVSGSSARHAQD
jgi:hypothetical protein